MGRTRRWVRHVALTGALLLGLTACGGPSGESGQVELTFTWWGNAGRHEITQEAIDLFESENPDITIVPEGTAGGSYWDKIAAQAAARDLPDVLQMDEQYLREYADRGLFLDLNSVDFDTSKFAPGTADAGVIGGALVAINNGINAPTIVANPALFEQAGVELPDDTTWTWDDYAEIAAAITANTPDGIYGSASFTSSDYTFATFVRQRGKELFTEDGLGFDVADAQAWFELELKMRAMGAIPTATEVTEDEALSMDQSWMSTGRVAMTSNVWTNQVGVIDEFSGEDTVVLRLPSSTGSAADAQLWFKPSQFFSAAADTEHPEEAARLISFLVNDLRCADILGDNRGVPPNTELRAQIEENLPAEKEKVFAYLNAIESELGAQPTAPPIGTSEFANTLKRYGQEVLFERQTAAEAAQALVDEMNRSIN